jgi:hypothetical protein
MTRERQPKAPGPANQLHYLFVQRAAMRRDGDGCPPN